MLDRRIGPNYRSDNFCDKTDDKIMIIKNHIIRLISTSKELGLIIHHRAICFECDGAQLVIHQTFSGPELITLWQFCKQRKILNAKQYTLKKDIDTDRLLQYPEYQRFNLFNRNCENYVNDIINEYTTTPHIHLSQQVAFWLTVIIIAILINKH